MKTRLTFIFLCLSITIHAQIMGSFTDSRDGQTYKTVSYEDPLLGEKFTVMAENLNYAMSGAFAYDNNEKYRNQLGLLYNFQAATNACPPNWHLPSSEEWYRFYELTFNISSAVDEPIATILKSKVGWGANKNGNNRSGFNALPAGMSRHSKKFENIGSITVWWTRSTELDRTNTLVINTLMINRVNNFLPFIVEEYYGISCRCFKD